MCGNTMPNLTCKWCFVWSPSWNREVQWARLWDIAGMPMVPGSGAAKPYRTFSWILFCWCSARGRVQVGIVRAGGRAFPLHSFRNKNRLQHVRAGWQIHAHTDEPGGQDMEKTVEQTTVLERTGQSWNDRKWNQHEARSISELWPEAGIMKGGEDGGKGKRMHSFSLT